MQFDDAAKLVYWELVGLYKDLFVTFYVDFEEKKIYQAACHGETVVSCREDGAWLHYEGEIPPTAVQIPRLKAERLEDLWREEFVTAQRKRIDKAVRAKAERMKNALMPHS